MFRVEQNVPDVYVQESRDFQLLSKLYDLVFQSSRFSIDSMRVLSDTMHCNESVLPLISTKVGFFTDSNLTDNSHRKILSAFPYIIKYKGSMKGLKLIVNLLGSILNTKIFVEQPLLDDLTVDRNRVLISFDKYAPDYQILEDILYYMRPTGCLIDYSIKTDIQTKTNFVLSADNVKITTNTDGKEIYPVNKISSNDTDYSYTSAIHDETKPNNIFRSTVGFTQIINTEAISTPIKREEKES